MSDKKKEMKVEESAAVQTETLSGDYASYATKPREEPEKYVTREYFDAKMENYATKDDLTALKEYVWDKLEQLRNQVAGLAAAIEAIKTELKYINFMLKIIVGAIVVYVVEHIFSKYF